MSSVSIYYVHINKYVCMYMYIYLDMYVSIYVYIFRYICMCIYVYLDMYMNICLYIHIYSRMYVHISITYDKIYNSIYNLWMDSISCPDFPQILTSVLSREPVTTPASTTQAVLSVCATKDTSCTASPTVEVRIFPDGSYGMAIVSIDSWLLW